MLSFPVPERFARAAFQEFCSSEKDVVHFFRSMVGVLSANNVSNYRLKISPTKESFQVNVRPAKGNKCGPRSFEYCLSCDPDKATIAECNYLGGEATRGPPEGLPQHLRSLTSGSCELVGLQGFENSLCRVWFDAQGRPLMIVTPRRHAHGLEDMTDSEIAAIWAAVGVVIRMEAQTNIAATFSEVVLNVGSYRNIEHSHVKVWFDSPDFLERISRWPEHMRRLQADLHELRRLMKLPSDDGLRAALANDVGEVELLVRGRFADADALALMERFARFGRVVRVAPDGDGRFREGALVVMADAAEAIEAVKALNLTQMGGNVMCKVKLVKALKK